MPACSQMSYSFGQGNFLAAQCKSLGDFIFSSGTPLSSTAQLSSCSSPKGSFLVERKGEGWKCSSLSRVLTLCHGLQPARLPCLWKSRGKNTGMGCHVLPQGVFLFRPRDQTRISCIAGSFLTVWATRKERGAPKVELASALLSLFPASSRLPFSGQAGRREWTFPYAEWVHPKRI